MKSVMTSSLLKACGAVALRMTASMVLSMASTETAAKTAPASEGAARASSEFSAALESPDPAALKSLMAKGLNLHAEFEARKDTSFQCDPQKAYILRLVGLDAKKITMSGISTAGIVREHEIRLRKDVIDSGRYEDLREDLMRVETQYTLESARYWSQKSVIGSADGSERQAAFVRLRSVAGRVAHDFQTKNPLSALPKDQNGDLETLSKLSPFGHRLKEVVQEKKSAHFEAERCQAALQVLNADLDELKKKSLAAHWPVAQYLKTEVLEKFIGEAPAGLTAESAPAPERAPAASSVEPASGLMGCAELGAVAN